MSYSNRSDLCDELASVVSRLADQGSESSSTVARSVANRHVPQPYRLSDRLGEAAIQELIESFKAGTPKHELADQYGVSLSGVKNLLRERGVRRKSRNR
jgi:hypothetical protein